MKEVLVLRHGSWDLKVDQLTEEAVKKCEKLKEKLPGFDIVISSDFNRNKQTAQLLSGSKASVDSRAGVLQMTAEQNKLVSELRKSHPLGVAGAIFSLPELAKQVKAAGQGLVSLIKETLKKLPADGKALIISHDGTMVAASKIIRKQDFSSIDSTYSELQGFVVDNRFNVRELDLSCK